MASTQQDELQSSSRRINLPPVGITSNIFPWICWGLWLSRNQLVFESKNLTQQQVINRAIVSCKEWESAQLTLPKPIITKPPPRMPPALTYDTVMCHTDAAWNKDHEVAGLAWICSSSDSIEMSRGSSIQRAVSSPIVAEALAIREALLHASALSYKRIWL
ncbi:hypothetical protein IGI04_021998 [Brassica rapa subsp. trilocularis]|uniref:RNase H type-1 domain-containing protein n=1 Tax=Brassica rapa subsp. trilocularis TaxID=1813537 RepID=A0ABQ7M2F2_BRACM|nr:hypothetical protein IGI04_021998 [Brassica rapa subsp. trilocularis]